MHYLHKFLTANPDLLLVALTLLNARTFFQ